MDNEDFKEEIRAYAALNKDTNQHYDSQISQDEDIDDASSVLSMPTAPPSPQPSIRDSAAMGKIMNSISILMTAGAEFCAYDPRICKG